MKRGKDEQQGMAVLNTVAEAMPHYRLDAAFVAELPPELQPHFTRWQQARGARPSPARRW